MVTLKITTLPANLAGELPSEKRGLNYDLISVKGAENLIAINDTELNRMKNRRVEFILK